MRNRGAWALAGSLLALHAALAWIARAPGIFRGDDVVYLLLARSLRGFRYEEIFRVDHPVHRMYPPGYPALLSAWSAAGGERFNSLVWAGILCSAASLLFVFLIANRKWGTGVALACLAALTFNAALIESSGWLASEAPFMMFACGALYAMTHESRFSTPAAGAAAIAAALTRTAGATLLVAMALYWFWRREYRKSAGIVCAAALSVGVWLIVSAGGDHVVGRSYFADFSTTYDGSTVLERTINRLPDKVRYLEQLYLLAPASFLPGTTLESVVAAVLVGIAFTAGLVIFWREWRIGAVYLATYAGLLVIWPWTLDRFLSPMLPFVVVAIVVGAKQAAARLSPRRAMAIAAALAAVLAANGIVNVIAIERSRRSCDRSGLFPSRSCVPGRYASFFDAARDIDRRLPDDARFVSGVPSTLYHFTGRQTVSLPSALSVPPDRFVPFLRDHRVTHVLLSAVMPFAEGAPQPGGTPLPEMVRANCRELRLEAAYPPSTLLLSVQAGGHEATPASCAAVHDFIAAYPRESKR